MVGAQGHVVRALVVGRPRTSPAASRAASSDSATTAATIWPAVGDRARLEERELGVAGVAERGRVLRPDHGQHALARERLAAVHGAHLAAGDRRLHGLAVGHPLGVVLEGVAGAARDLLARLEAGERRADGAREHGSGHEHTSASVETSTLRASGTLKALSRSGSAAASSASAAARKASSAAGAAAQRRLRALGAPRDVREPAERDPAVAHRVAVELDGDRDRDDRERVGRAVADLAVGRARRRRAARQLERHDQLAGLEHRVALRLVAGQPVQAGDRDRRARRPGRRRARSRRAPPARPPCPTGAWRRTPASARAPRGCGARPRAPGSPSPARRLLHGFVTSWKYAQRVRWSRLPPTVATLRSWPDAPASTACASSG